MYYPDECFQRLLQKELILCRAADCDEFIGNERGAAMFHLALEAGLMRTLARRAAQSAFPVVVAAVAVAAPYRATIHVLTFWRNQLRKVWLTLSVLLTLVLSRCVSHTFKTTD